MLLLVAIGMLQNVFADMSGSSFALMSPLCNMQYFAVSLIFKSLSYLFNKKGNKSSGFECLVQRYGSHTINLILRLSHFMVLLII